MIAFDTAPLIYGLINQSVESPDDINKRCDLYIKKLAAAKTQLIIPSPVLAEYFELLTEEEREVHGAVFDRCFIIGNLDAPAARKAAELAGKLGEKKKEIREKSKAQPPATRQQMKTDFYIIAIAATMGVEKLVTSPDQIEDFQAMAQQSVRIAGIPDLRDLLPNPNLFQGSPDPN